METKDLYTKCIEGARLRDDYSTFAIHRFPIGKINIVSGKIVACDPFMISKNDHHFHQEAPSGEYDVSLIIATNLTNNDERVAGAYIDFSNKTPEKWIMATKGHQKLSDLRENHIYGYGVDSGTGSFLDLESAKALVHNFMTNENYFEELNEHFDENYISTRSWVIYEVDPVKKLNVAMFSSGYGDGFYPSYWGYANDNSVICVLTDFGILGSAEFGGFDD